MKLLFASLLIALATSTAPAAAVESPPQPAAIAAPSAEQLDLARRFVALTEPVGSLLDMMREAAHSSAQAQLDPEADEAERAALVSRVDQIIAKLEPRFTAERPEIIEAYAQAYARQFNTEELRAMVAFGSSPAGQHFLSSTVDIESDPEVLEANQLLNDAMLSVMDEVRKDSCAERAAAKVAMGDTKATCPLAKSDEARTL